MPRGHLRLLLFINVAAILQYKLECKPHYPRYQLNTSETQLFKNHMAQFTEDLQSLRPSFPFLDTDPSMELINQFIGMNTHVMENSHVNMQNLMPFSCDSFFGSQEPEFQGNLEESFLPGLVHHVNNNAVPVPLPNFPAENEIHEGKKRKAMDVPATSSANSTPAASDSGSNMKKVNFFY